MPRNSSSTLTRSVANSRAARAARAAHLIDGTTYNLADAEHPTSGWSARCSCGASSGDTRYASRDEALAAHAGHVRRYLPAGAR